MVLTRLLAYSAVSNFISKTQGAKTYSCSRGARRKSKPQRNDQHYRTCSTHGEIEKTSRLIYVSVEYHRQHNRLQMRPHL